MQEPLQLRHAALHPPRRRRHEDGVARPSTADPVLAAPELSWQPIGTPPTGQQHGMDLLQQTGGEGKAGGQPGQAVFQGGHVAGHLHHIIEGNPGSLRQLEQQQIREGGLGALDLAGEQGFAADVGVDEKVGIGEQAGNAIEAPSGQESAIVEGLTQSAQLERGLGWQRIRHEGPDRLPGGAGDFVVARGLPIHLLRWRPRLE